MKTDDIKRVEAFLDALLENRPLPPSAGAGGSSAIGGIEERIGRLGEVISELNRFSLALAEGNVDAEAPPRTNFLAAGLKQLQAQMRHLTWQAQHVAQGDYRQRVDFMGEFSTAFNEMVEQLRLREENLFRQQQVMEMVFNQIEPIVVLDTEEPSEILYINKTAARLFGIQVGDGIPEKGVLAYMLSLRPSGVGCPVFDEENGKWYDVTVQEVRWGSHQQACVFFCRDITENKVLEELLRGKAEFDACGIADPAAFEASVERHWRNCILTGKPMSFVMLELDGFKTFSQTCGAERGDMVLADFSRILSRCIGRREDIITCYPHNLFAAALPFTGQESALYVTKNICKLMARRVLSAEGEEGAESCLTVSAGVSSVVPRKGASADQLAAAAGRALDQARKNGGNCTRFRPVMDILPKQGGEDAEADR